MADEKKKIVIKKKTESEQVEQPQTPAPVEPPKPADDNMPVLPSFMQGATLKPATQEEVEQQMKPQPITIHAGFGAAVSSPNISKNIANEVAAPVPAHKKLSENKFFSEAHKASVEHHNDMIENLTSSDSVNLIVDDTEFEKLIQGEKDVSILDDGDVNYAQACCRNVLSSVAYYYGVVLMHTGLKVNFTGLRYLSKSKLLNSPEDMYHDRLRLYKTIWEQIESISGFATKPNFEVWSKITSFLDTDSMLFGVYAATYPTDQSFTVECPKCSAKLELKTNPENLVAVYDDAAYQKVKDIISTTPNAEEIIKNSALSKIFKIPVREQKIVLYVKEPSIADFLNMLSEVTKDPTLYETYEVTFEKTMYIAAAFVPDIAFYKRSGTLRFVKVTNKRQIASIIANLDQKSGLAVDECIEKLNEHCNVRFEIPETTCHAMLKDAEGKFTSEECGQHIDKINLDMEKLLFRSLRSTGRDEG
jgi:hypothetical protein